jgi:hypothetical protein
MNEQRDPTDTGDQHDPTQTGLQRLLERGDPRAIRQLADDLEDTELLHLERGAEPFWMQDVRIAQSALEAARRAARASSPQPEPES